MILEFLALSIILSSSFIEGLHILYGLGFIKSLFSRTPRRTFSRDELRQPLVTVIVPVKNEDIEVMRRTLSGVAEMYWDKERLEIILVSDDHPSRWRDIEEMIDMVRSDHKVKILSLFRESPVGGRNGAINEALARASGQFIVVLDADSIPDPHYLVYAYKRIETDGCDAVVGRWRGYSYYNTRIGRALVAATDFVETLLMKGRSELGLYIVPLGSGTLYKRQVFDLIGPIEHDIVQDDYWIGLKMFSKNLRTCYEERALVNVMVPSEYEAFKIQQTRWAYGAVQAGVRGLGLIRSSRESLLKKLELLLYAFQYTPTIFIAYSTPLYSLLYILSAPAQDPVESLLPVFILWLIVSGVYIGLYIVVMSLRYRERVFHSILRLGTSSALTTALSPLIAYNQLRALMRRRGYVYRVTPKGVYERYIGRSSRLLVELVYTVVLAPAVVLSLARLHILTALVLGPVLLAFIYVLVINIARTRGSSREHIETVESLVSIPRSRS